MELYERIRMDNREPGMGIRALAARHHVHRRIVREALASAVPPERKVPERTSPALGQWTTVIRAWLVADRDAPRKQRHTARRVHQRLVAEYGAELAESTVRAYVAQVNFELDNVLRVVTVPQTHGPGEEAEVDFGEFVAFIDGVLVKCWMFCMRLSHSGRGFHVAFSHQAQEAFFEGHVAAFAHFGAVPGRIRYDNLKAAVAKVLFGRDRIENERFVTLRSHYRFDSFYCTARHRRGATRRAAWRARSAASAAATWSRCPRSRRMAELNDLLAAGDVIDDARHIASRPDPVGVAAAAEVASMAPLPGRAVRPGRHPGGQGRHQRPGVGAPELLLGARGPGPAGGDGAPRRPGLRGHRRRAGSWPATSAACTRAPRTWCWTTTWRSSSASPGPCPAPPPWPRPGRRGPSAPPTSGSGPRPAASWATGPAPGRSSGWCCCSGGWPPTWSSPPWRRRWSSAASIPRWWPSRPGAWRGRRPPAPVVPIGTGRPRHPSGAPPRPLRRAAAAGGRVVTLAAMTEPAAEAAIVAACRALHLPTVRAEAPALADTAAKERVTHRAYLAEVLARPRSTSGTGGAGPGGWWRPASPPQAPGGLRPRRRSWHQPGHPGRPGQGSLDRRRRAGRAAG